MATIGVAPSARARGALGGLLAFVLLVYANPTHWFPALPDLGYAKLAAGATAILLFFAWLLGDRPLTMAGQLGFVLAFLYLWTGASALWSLWPAATVDIFLDGLKFLAAFFLVANLVDDGRRAALFVHWLGLCSLIPALGAISSWSRGEHLVEGDRAAWVGLFANPNDLAHYLIVGIAMSLGAREISRSRGLRLVYLPVLVVLTAALLLTQSRGGLLAGGTVFALWALRGVARGRQLVGVAVAAALTVQLAPETAWKRAETAFDYEEDASAQGRIDAWRTGLHIAAERPLSGVGAGVFALAWPEFAPGDAGPPRSAHNTFVQIVGETGFPALALFVAALGIALVRVNRLARQVRNEIGVLARANQVALLGFAVCSLTGGYAYSWPLYLLLGLAASLHRSANQEAVDA